MRSSPLRWADVELDQGQLEVVQQLTLERGRPVLKQLKTEYSERLVTFGPATSATLVEHRQHQREEADFVGGAWMESGLVFTTNLGGWIDRWRQDRLHAKRMCRRAQLLARRPVRTRQDLHAHGDGRPHLGVGQVENPLEDDVVAVEMTGQEALDTDRLALTEPPYLGHRARARVAHVENGEAAWRVEPAAVDPGAFPAQRIVARAEVPPAAPLVPLKRSTCDPARVDPHRARQSRPRPLPGPLR